jgi:transcriptional regulator with XRE-family HTH domain
MQQRRVRPKKGKVYSGARRLEATTTFAARLQTRLEELNWTNNELAKRLDCHKQQVSRWTTGKDAPSSQSLRRIAQALGVSMDYLMPAIDEEPTK